MPAVLPEAINPQAGSRGLVLFLALLTERNDIAQFLRGNLSGHHKISPTVSPNKTRAGFIGGVAATAPPT